MYSYDFLIVGAGLFGSVLARELTDSGKRCLLLEQKNHVAGNCYTECVQGIHVHRCGPHIFHTDNEVVWKYMQRFCSFYPFINRPKLRYQDRIFPLPINLMTLHQLWGVTSPEEAKKLINKKRLPIEDPQNFEEYILSQLGEEIYTIFFKGYTEKQWGRDAKEVPVSTAKRLPIRFSFEDNYFTHRFQGIPSEGYTKVVENMLEGIDVRLNTDFLKEKNTLEALAVKTIFTGAIDRYFDFIFGPLEYRTMRFEYEEREGDVQGNAVINYSEREIPYVRSIEHKHFLGQKFDHSIMSYEYPVEWKEGMEPHYPISTEKNKKKYEQYKTLAKEKSNVIFGGRLGEYRYYDMDQVVASSLACAEDLKK